MADNARIEDLRKRYHENPRRFFAPLANEYRKSGFLDRGLLLCQKHVPEQPENMNGLVVYGQILFEMGQPDAAREPFEQALKLDPENLIALRHLGDIARLAGDVPTAKGWYERVLELDRRNDEVLDLLAQLGGADAAAEAPSARPSTNAAGLISVAPTVSVSGADDLGLINLDAPVATPVAPAPPPAAPGGKGGTMVINAQALADRDRREAEGGAVTQPVAAVKPPAAPIAPAADAPTTEVPAVAPPARPSKRASLLDIDFDFSETEAAEPAKPVPAAPVLGAEAAEYGFADVGVPDVDPGASTLIIEPTAAADSLAAPAAAPAAPVAGDFELAEFSADVSPLAGLEANEFSSETVAPLAELDADSVSMSAPTVAPLAGLDNTGLGMDMPVEPESFSAPEPLAEPTEPAAPDLDALGLPLLDEPSAVPTASISEPPSARPKPRMTKADLSSLPLLADFGLEDAEPSADSPAVPTPQSQPAVAEAIHAETPSAPAAPPSAPRASKATPTFVTETMAALYVQQGLLPQAIGVYQQLVEASPTDAGLRAKLAELERMHAQASAPAPAPEVDMPEFEPSPEIAEAASVPADAALAAVSFGGIGLQGQGTPTPIVTPAVPSGPTAREFFATFARRAAVAVGAAAVIEAATAVPPATTGWPLDALLGAAGDVRDLHAAEVLAGVGSFTGPDGGSGLESLLAEAASGGSGARRSVPRASEMLKFDQFFQKPGTAAPDAMPQAAAPGDDDLGQFQDWLKGLKK